MKEKPVNIEFAGFSILARGRYRGRLNHFRTVLNIIPTRLF
jgi:hypothetical protein